MDTFFFQNKTKPKNFFLHFYFLQNKSAMTKFVRLCFSERSYYLILGKRLDTQKLLHVGMVLIKTKATYESSSTKSVQLGKLPHSGL